MTFLFENPLPILIMGGVTLAIIAGGWLQTQRRELALAFVAALVMIAGLLVLERTVVTDAEAISQVIHHIAAKAEANDTAALAQHFHSSAGEFRALLEQKMQQFHVESVSIKSNLKVQATRRTGSPPTAVATFNVVAVISDHSGALKSMNIPQFVTANFQMEDGAWRCTGFKHEDPHRGMQTRE